MRYTGKRRRRWGFWLAVGVWALLAVWILTAVVADSVYFGDSKRTVSDSDTPPFGEFQELPEEEKGELPF